jgi:hypothetical protein
MSSVSVHGTHFWCTVWNVFCFCAQYTFWCSSKTRVLFTTLLLESQASLQTDKFSSVVQSTSRTFWAQETWPRGRKCSFSKLLNLSRDPAPFQVFGRLLVGVPMKSLSGWLGKLSWLAPLSSSGTSTCYFNLFGSSDRRPTCSELWHIWNALKNIEILHSVWWYVRMNLLVWTILFDIPIDCPSERDFFGWNSDSVFSRSSSLVSFIYFLVFKKVSGDHIQSTVRYVKYVKCNARCDGILLVSCKFQWGLSMV